MTEKRKKDLYFFFDKEAPNWLSTDQRGAKIINYLDGKRNFAEIVRKYGRDFNLNTTLSWLHCHTFLKGLARSGFASLSPFKKPVYLGRKSYLNLKKLEEFWIHTNNSCNLTCSHCLVSSSPEGDYGLSTEKLKQVIDEAINLGVEQFFFTGGEPFLRKDIFTLIDYVVKKARLIILSNGTLLHGKVIEHLKRYDPQKLQIQISLDGSTPQINDPLRGKGSFKTIIKGIENTVKIGFLSSITTVMTKKNINNLSEITKLIAELAGRNHHLLWLHKRGKASSGNGLEPTVNNIIQSFTEAKHIADTLGITIDNFELMKLRADSESEVKRDLDNACYTSLALNCDGYIYPSPPLVGIPSFQCGSIFEKSLKEIWHNSRVGKMFRSVTVQEKKNCAGCYLKFICGGGNTEYNLIPTHKSGVDTFKQDPYCKLYKFILEEAISQLAQEKKDKFNTTSGFNAPIIYHHMGEGQISCGSNNGKFLDKESIRVDLIRCNCVLSVDIDKPRKLMREFYTNAAKVSQPGLCCPTGYPKEEVSHIPQEVLDRFYGCGSPVGLAEIKSGEIVVDLGSGAGIDCFIAAKKVGEKGKVIGVDMTEEMLTVAGRNNEIVSKNLTYDVVEFRKGFLEEIPVKNKSVDLVTSNCVINLSPDKKIVFAEIWRVLKDNGRIIISDIVSDRKLSAHLKVNVHLWGECISGALTEEEFLGFLEEAGFYGITLIKKSYWKEVEGYKFYSATIRGYKFEKKKGCVYKGQKALYHGHFKAVIDEEGHLFPRDEEVEICTDTAKKLKSAPYDNSFTVIDGDGKIKECCTPGGKPC